METFQDGRPQQSRVSSKKYEATTFVHVLKGRPDGQEQMMDDTYVALAVWSANHIESS